MNMTTDTTALHRKAEHYIDFLTLPEPIAKKGETWCFAQRLLLKITLSNELPEAQERLQKKVTEIQEALK